FAPADVLAKKQRAATEMAHRRLEADARAQRRPLEQERLDASGEDRIADALGKLVFQLLAELENSPDVTRRQLEQRQYVSHAVSFSSNSECRIQNDRCVVLHS